MVRVEAILVPILLIERELGDRHRDEQSLDYTSGRCTQV